MSRVESQVRPAALLPLWFGVLGGPVAWGLHLLVSYLLATLACIAGLDGMRVMIGALTGCLALVALGATAVAFGTWRHTGAGTRTDIGGSAGRSAFLAIAGVLTSGLSCHPAADAASVRVSLPDRRRGCERVAMARSPRITLGATLRVLDTILAALYAAVLAARVWSWLRGGQPPRPQAVPPGTPTPPDRMPGSDSNDADARQSGDQEPSPERRRLLTAVGLAGGGVVAAVLGVPVVGFILSPLLKEETDEWRAVGSAAQFPVGDTVKVSFLDPSPLSWSGPAAMTAAWLRREAEDRFVAFAVNCTHLGCAVRWEAGPRFFMCPCHGGVFYENGDVAAGPPPRPLAQYGVRVRDGQVEVRTGGVPITGELLP
jgi:menaquinol-cytochrome c reductase iron-sulfur subunit